jgi:hypothetical protein
MMTSQAGNLPGALASGGAFKAAPQRLQNFNRSLVSMPHVGQYMVASTSNRFFEKPRCRSLNDALRQLRLIVYLRPRGSW